MQNTSIETTSSNAQGINTELNDIQSLLSILRLYFITAYNSNNEDSADLFINSIALIHTIGQRVEQAKDILGFDTSENESFTNSYITPTNSTIH